VSAESAPAVSNINSKVSLHSGDDGLSGVVGSITFPLTHSWGAQVDMATANHDAGDISFVGGHLFWRNPEKGLVGFLGSKHSSTYGDTEELGFQAEKFFANFTLRAELGYQSNDRRAFVFADGQSPSPNAIGSLGTLSVNDDFWAVKGSWYATEDIVAFAKSERSIGRNGHTSIGLEWQIGSTNNVGYSLYSEYKDVDGYGTQGLIGFRMYFDGKKNLKTRHRTADPAVSYDASGYPTCPPGYELSTSGGGFTISTSCVGTGPFGFPGGFGGMN
tara:strand:- start:287 stop:1108 length:822 start_codon:yes stop_codon:yes gene_type:complete